MKLTIAYEYEERAAVAGGSARKRSGHREVEIREVEPEQAVIAIQSWPLGYVSRPDHKVQWLWHDGRLWTCVPTQYGQRTVDPVKGLAQEFDPERTARESLSVSPASRANAILAIDKWALNWIMVGGRFFRPTEEPCYGVSTRRGRKGDKAHLFISDGPCANDFVREFAADQFAQATEFCKRLHGDRWTSCPQYLREHRPMFDVHMPDALKVARVSSLMSTSATPTLLRADAPWRQSVDATDLGTGM